MVKTTKKAPAKSKVLVESQEISQKKEVLQFTDHIDMVLLNEIDAQWPYGATYGHVSAAWEAVCSAVNKTCALPTHVNVTVRNAKDRSKLLLKQFQVRMAKEMKASGISPVMTEKDVLLESINSKLKSAEDEESADEKEKNVKKRREQTEAELLREQAVKRMCKETIEVVEDCGGVDDVVKVTKKNSKKLKKNNGSIDTVFEEYLKGQMRMEAEDVVIRQKELEVKERQLKLKESEVIASQAKDKMLLEVMSGLVQFLNKK